MTDAKIKLGVLWKAPQPEGKTPYLSGRVQRDNLDPRGAALARRRTILGPEQQKRPRQTGSGLRALCRAGA